jgi:hypothetical protein
MMPILPAVLSLIAASVAEDVLLPMATLRPPASAAKKQLLPMIEELEELLATSANDSPSAWDSELRRRWTQPLIEAQTIAKEIEQLAATAKESTIATVMHHIEGFIRKAIEIEAPDGKRAQLSSARQYVREAKDETRFSAQESSRRGLVTDAMRIRSFKLLEMLEAEARNLGIEIRVTLSPSLFDWNRLTMAEFYWTHEVLRALEDIVLSKSQGNDYPQDMLGKAMGEASYSIASWMLSPGRGLGDFERYAEEIMKKYAISREELLSYLDDRLAEAIVAFETEMQNVLGDAKEHLESP